jgi:hypothetical protein
VAGASFVFSSLKLGRAFASGGRPFFLLLGAFRSLKLFRLEKRYAPRQFFSIEPRIFPRTQKLLGGAWPVFFARLRRVASTRVNDSYVKDGRG